MTNGKATLHRGYRGPGKSTPLFKKGNQNKSYHFSTFTVEWSRQMATHMESWGLLQGFCSLKGSFFFFTAVVLGLLGGGMPGLS